MSSPSIHWYPGHIAKAEKQLKSNLAKVDLIIEVRDARIPLATSHPHLDSWSKGKKHLLVINRLDMIPREALNAWDKHLRNQGHSPWWCNAKAGTGVKQLQKAALLAGRDLNERRRARGMRARAVRALTIGFPNVGKSALINRLVQKKVVESAPRAGVTRSLRWVRLGKELDLLDAPGVLPPRLDDQKAAFHLALCDDIGNAAYDVESVAVSFIKLLKKLEATEVSGVEKNLLGKRYGKNLNNKTNIQYWLLSVAKLHTSGDTERMSQRILDDFRKTLLGFIALELP